MPAQNLNVDSKSDPKTLVVRAEREIHTKRFEEDVGAMLILLERLLGKVFPGEVFTLTRGRCEKAVAFGEGIRLRREGFLIQASFQTPWEEGSALRWVATLSHPTNHSAIDVIEMLARRYPSLYFGNEKCLRGFGLLPAFIQYLWEKFPAGLLTDGAILNIRSLREPTAPKGGEVNQMLVLLARFGFLKKEKEGWRLHNPYQATLPTENNIVPLAKS